MKPLIATVLVVLLAGCRTYNPGMDTSILLHNINGSFVTQRFAERLALLVLEEKYPKELFLLEGSVDVRDKGDFWSVTCKNALYRPENYMIPKTLTFQIKKSNGEFIAIL